MVSEASLSAASARRASNRIGGGSRFTKPAYDGYAFAQIPQTLRRLLTNAEQPGVPFTGREELAQKYDTVILLFLDAFGWCFVERYLDRHPLLQRIEQDGLISVISSQFPSTTAAHVTAIHTGQPVGESGIYEWTYYEPIVGELITPLPFSFAGDNQPESLWQTRIEPTAFFPSHTIYQELTNHHVDSVVLQDAAFAHSAFTGVVTNGSTLVPYRTLSQALVMLTERLVRQEKKTYYFLYYDKIDTISHLHGPSSPHVEAEIFATLDAVDRILTPALARQHSRTLLLITADHGQVGVDPATTCYLNLEVPELLPFLKRTRSGRFMAPAGSPRDMFIHVEDEHEKAALQLLQHRLNGKAEVCAVSELLASGYFGKSAPSAPLLSRIGDLVVLPFAGDSVWWYEKGRFDQHYYGHHGGLTPEEMETVLMALG